MTPNKSKFSPTPGRRFHKRVQAFAKSVSYDFETRIGTIHLRDFGSSDMSGAIETIRHIDSDARRVDVYVQRSDDEGYQLDIVYAGVGRFVSKSDWKAFDVRSARVSGHTLDEAAFARYAAREAARAAADQVEEDAG